MAAAADKNHGRSLERIFCVQQSFIERKITKHEHSSLINSFAGRRHFRRHLTSR